VGKEVKEMSKRLLVPAAGLVCAVLCIVLVAAREGSAQDEVKLSKGQTVYVPVYSHVYSMDKERDYYLTATLSIRNTDMKHPISILTADYYDTHGKRLRGYIEAPVQLDAMGSTHYVIEEFDKSGGVGANFVVRWKSNQPVNSPLMEAVMISTRGQQGISFTSRGQVIKED
jgi:hypothetical protein